MHTPNYKVVKSSELYHHGIKGQKWGDRNGPPYPLDYNDHSAKEKRENSRSKIGGTEEKKGLTDKQKTALKIGAAAVGVALVAAGGVYLVKSGKGKELIELGKEAIRKQKHILPKDAGGITNPGGYDNNCKDVAEATLKRWFGIDPGAVAGPKSVNGNLHDFIAARGYNSAGVHWLGTDGSITPDPSGNSLERVSRQILKKCKDGDAGFITISWDPNKVLTSGSEDAHCFNWYINNGIVKFFDDQPDPPLIDAARHLKLVNPNVEIELCKITKEAFVK